MKRIIVLIALSLVIIISITSITSITAISFEQNQYEDENSIIENETLDGNSKALIEQFYNDKSLSTQDKEEMKDNGSNPKTGDNIMLYVAIASMSIIGLVATTIVAKKKKMN